MHESESSESESVEIISSEENSENETADVDSGEGKPVEYERERLKRIEENKKRMEALGLHKMASSVMGSFQRSNERNKDKKGKKKMVDEDEEYNPDDEVRSSSGEEDESDEEFSGSRKKKVKKNSPTFKKHDLSQKPMLDLDIVDDDDDDDLLMQAIALSLQDSGGFLDVKSSFLPQRSDVQHKEISTSTALETRLRDTSSDKRNENDNVKGDSGKRKKPVANRILMSEDEVLIHFFQFDESGKGGFTLRDLKRMVDAHNFTWSEKEMADMIHCFDGNGDGKISFDDFRKIVCQCNMLKGSDNVMASK